MTASNTFDHVIVGGGLQGCLLAHAIAHHQPAARVLLAERANELCGNHTWSFHASDIPASARSWLDPLISKSWPGYLVSFPGLSRRVGIAYQTIASDDLSSGCSNLDWTCLKSSPNRCLTISSLKLRLVFAISRNSLACARILKANIMSCIERSMNCPSPVFSL